METSQQKLFYVLVVGRISELLINTVRQIRQNDKYKNLQLLLVSEEPELSERYKNEPEIAQILFCDYTADGIKQVLTPYLSHIRAVLCRGDRRIAQLRDLIPHLPANVLVSSESSLRAATDKQLMRQAFTQHFPEITPQFVQVDDDSEDSIKNIESRLSYPVIVKPTRLASSLLIQSCHNRFELKRALQQVFSTIDEISSANKRRVPSQVIVEEYLEGDFYSIDAYVMSPGQVYCCPIVEYIPAKKLGVDDFFLHKRFFPTDLSEAQTKSAEQVVQKAITALGLTHTVVHAELVLTGQGWKIIEVGPRLGRFRHRMYSQAYGIDHSLNDLYIHLGLPPVIPKRMHKYCSAYSFYPYQEGRFRGLPHWEDLSKRPEFVWGRMAAEPGVVALHAKHGGKALAEAVVASDNKKIYDDLCSFIESSVVVDIDIG